jgi:hypothetical protein
MLKITIVDDGYHALPLAVYNDAPDRITTKNNKNINDTHTK